jgi:hypothetical protein
MRKLTATDYRDRATLLIECVNMIQGYDSETDDHEREILHRPWVVAKLEREIQNLYRKARKLEETAGK